MGEIRICAPGPRAFYCMSTDHSYCVGGVFGLRNSGLYSAIYPRDNAKGVLAGECFCRARGTKLSRIFLSPGRPAVARSLSEARWPPYRGRAHRLGASACVLHVPVSK